MHPLVLALLILCGAVLCLLLVCAVRAAAMKKKLSGKPSVLTWTPEEETLYAERLSEMVRCPTISKKQPEPYPEFLAFQEKMRALFPLVHARAEDHSVEGNVLLRIPGGAPEKGGVLLMGHQDVVPADQAGWTDPPFAGVIRDGCVWGRGSMDCKSTVCCEYSAVEELLASSFQPKEDLWLFSSRNEENSGGGSEAAVRYLKENGYKINLVMDEGGAVIGGVFPGLTHPCSAIGVVEKGFCNLKFTAKGAGGHASTPPKNTPVARLAKFVAAAERKNLFRKKMVTPIPEMFGQLAPYLPFYFRFVLGNLWLFGPLVVAVLPRFSPMAGAFVATTAAFTMCGGSDTPNVLPDEAYVIANIRPSVQQNGEASIDALRRLAAKYDVETEVMKSRDASRVTSPDSAEFRFLQQCIREALPDTLPIPYLMTGGTDSRQFESVCDNVLRFTPTRLTAEQLAAMHAANENIGVQAVAEGVKFYRYYLEKLNERD